MYYLLDKGKCTAPELAEKFEVSTRTIYRDLDVISAAGIPIYATQGKGGGISILPEYVMICSQNWERCFKPKQKIGLRWTFRIG